jgi:hypothetical protein
MRALRVRAGIAVGLLGLLGGATAPARAADTVASDFALPHWQGTKTSTAAAGHQVDCRITSGTPRSDHTCDVSVATITSGQNCYLEDPSDSATALNPAPRRPTPCTALVHGTAHWLPTPAGCVLEPTLRLDFSSGVNATLYSFSDIPVGATFVPLTGYAGPDYYLDVYDIGGSTAVHTPEIRERFVVRFNSPMPAGCPSNDARTCSPTCTTRFRMSS